MHHVLITLSRPSTGSTKNFMVERNLHLRCCPHNPKSKTVRMMNEQEFAEFIIAPLTRHFSYLMVDGWNTIKIRRCNYGMFADNQENLLTNV